METSEVFGFLNILELLLSNTFGVMLEEALSFLSKYISDYGFVLIVFSILVRFVLSPITIFQNYSSLKNEKIRKDISHLEEEFSGDDEGLKKAIAKHNKAYSDLMTTLTCLLLQMPLLTIVFATLYQIDLTERTMLFPWVATLSDIDPYYILTVLYVLISVIPGIYVYAKDKNEKKVFPFASVAIYIIFGIIFIAKAPLVIGLYLTVGSLYFKLEKLLITLIFNKVNKRKEAIDIPVPN